MSGDERHRDPSECAPDTAASAAQRGRVVEHYEAQLRKHGPTASGMDWKDAASQELRFRMLTDGLDLSGAKVHDVGAGAGHLYDFLKARAPDVDYSGSDLSPDMVEAARTRHPGIRFLRKDVLDLDDATSERFDYLFCSGLFHVKLDCPDPEWGAFVEAAVRRMYELCDVAIAFNMMSNRVDYRASALYYSDPESMRAICTQWSDDVVVRHDYPLYEYTVQVFKRRRPAFDASRV